MKRFRRLAAARTTAAAMLLWATLAHAAPEVGHGLAMPRDVSTEGHRIDWLIHVTLVFIAILFAIMVGWMLIACFRHDRKHKAHYDHGDGKRAMLVPLGIAAVVFLVVDGNLFVHSTLDMHDVFWNFARAESQPDVVKIEINAHQWAWDARYAGPDGKWNTPDDIVTLNDIRVPVGAPIVFQMGSTDVIHSFYLPHFRAKMDVVPGTLSRLWIQARETGEFEIGCAQHCGVNHYKMKGLLTVMTREDYDRWAEQASALAVRAHDPDARDAHWGWEWRKP